MSGKIIFIASIMSGGGASRVISILANHYAQKGWNVTLIMRSIQKAYVLDERIHVIEAGLSRIFLPHFINLIRREVKSQPDCIVVSFQSMINVYAGWGIRGLPVRWIASERNDIRLSSPEWVFRLAAKSYARADCVVFQSERVQNYFDETVQSHSRIILNPVLVACEAAPRRMHRIVSSGRLVPQKNQRLLIDAFAQIHEDYPDYRLTIYGEGALRQDLERRIQELDLEDFVELPGNVSQIHEAIADSEMFVLSSDYEGLSNSMLECMMMGIACISTRCAGSDEILSDHENGLLVSVGDCDALASAIRELIEDPALRGRLERKAKETSVRFRFENVIRQWEETFESGRNELLNN